MYDDQGVDLLLKARSVKELLRDLIDETRLSMDLSFYLLLYGDGELAERVLDLEKKIHLLELQLAARTLIAIRSPDDALRGISIYKLGTALDKMANASGDIAKAFKTFRPDFTFGNIYSEGEELIARLNVDIREPAHIDSILERLNVVVDVVALRRGEHWFMEPPTNMYIKRGDVVLVKGSRSAVEAFATAVGASLRESQALPSYVSDYLLELSKTVNIMYSLALATLLTRNKWLADYVMELEEHVDTVLLKFEKTLLASYLGENERAALLFAAFAIEHMADSALEMVFPILEGIDPHSLLLEVLEETKERISVIEMDESDAGLTLSELGYQEKGVLVLAVKRGKKWFIMPPYTGFKVQAGDVLLVKYYEESEEFVEKEEAEEDREEIIEDVWEEEESKKAS